MHRIRLVRLTLAASIAVISCSAFAQSGDVKARNWASSCNACHGPNGNSEGVMPVLAGRNKGDLAKAMEEFRDGKRKATVMHQIVKGYTPEELAAIADFYSRQVQK